MIVLCECAYAICSILYFIVYAHSAIGLFVSFMLLFVIFACLFFFFFFCSTLTVSLSLKILFYTFLLVESGTRHTLNETERVSEFQCAAEYCECHTCRYIIVYFVSLTERLLNDRHTFEPIFFRHLFLVGIKLRTVSIVHL